MKPGEPPTPPQPRPRPSPDRPPYLPTPESRLDYLAPGYVRPVTSRLPPSASVHFSVHPQLREVQDYARSRGWPQRGFPKLSVTWQELHWTTDGWATTHVLKSTDVPCPVMNGHFYLPNLERGTQVEFAVRVGLACHAPSDTAGARDVGELWFNNGGANYLQHAK